MKRKVKHQVELRGINYRKRESRASLAFDAKLYVDGELMAIVHNDGRGRKHKFVPAPGVKPPELKTVLSELEDLSYLDRLEDQVRMKNARRNLQSVLSRRVVFVEDGVLKHENLKGRDPGSWDAVREEHPDAIILNELPIDEALELYRKHGGIPFA